MKIATTLFLFLFVSLNIRAQNNPFPTDNATWTNRHQEYYYDSNTSTLHITNEQYSKFCVNGSDTLINATNYNEIFACDLTGSNYFGAFREDSGQIYFVPADSTNEFLLYDFTLNEGDFQDVIVQDVWDNSFSIANTQISSVDTITVNNTQRRLLYTNDGFSWVEGIGSSTGLFKGNGANVSNYFIDLICVSDNSTIIYDFDNGNGGPLAQGVSGTCDLALSIDETDNTSDFSIYPNPTNGLLNIKIMDNSEIETIRLTNNLGQVILTFNAIETGITTFEMDGPSGIYFIELIAIDGKKTIQKVVRQ